MLGLLILSLGGQLCAGAIIDAVDLEGRQYSALTYAPVDAISSTTGASASTTGSSVTGTGASVPSTTSTAAPFTVPPASFAGRVSPIAYALNILVPLYELLSDGISRFTAAQFTAAGLSDQNIQTITQIRDQQSSFIGNIGALRDSINSFNSANFCPKFHDFDLTDVNAFLTLVRSLATVVISAHTDALNNLASGESKTLLTTILAQEVQQLNSLNSLGGKSPTPNSPVIPLGLRTVGSIIRNYYDDTCFIPGVQLAERLPLLAVSPSAPGIRTQLPAGTVAAIDYLNPNPADQCVFLMSFNSASGSFAFRKQVVPIINKTCTVPADATGFVSIVIARVTSGNDQTDANSIAAGPIVSIR